MEVFSALGQVASIGESLSRTALNVYNVVRAIASDADTLRSELELQRATINSELVGDFSAAAREVNYRAKETQEMFATLYRRWRDLSGEISRATSMSQLDQWQVQSFIQRTFDQLAYASQCEHSFSVFKESLNYALRIASCLQARTQQCASKAKSKAKGVKAGGYSAAGVMGAGAVACGVAAIFTGGLSLIGTAVLGAGAAAAAATTRKRAAQLDQLAEEFQRILGRINDSVRDMNMLADKVESARLMGLSAVHGLEDELHRLKVRQGRCTADQLTKRFNYM